MCVYVCVCVCMCVYVCMCEQVFVLFLMNIFSSNRIVKLNFVVFFVFFHFYFSLYFFLFNIGVKGLTTGQLRLQ